MIRINAAFYILIISAFFFAAILMILPDKAYALLAAEKLSCMGGKIISSPFPYLSLAGAGLTAVLLLYALIQIIKTRLFLYKLKGKIITHPFTFRKILKKHNLAQKVILVKDKKLYSFCAGFFRPCIVVSSALANSLTRNELEAVLLHEQSHLISRDPLKLLIGQTFSKVFFFLPVLGELHKKSESAAEVLADEWSVKYQKKTLYLRSAMKKILSSPSLNFNLAANAGGGDYFEIRIRRLNNPKFKSGLRFSGLSLISTLLFVLTAAVLLKTPAEAAHMQNPQIAQDCHTKTQNQSESAYIPAHMLAPEKRCD